MLVDYLFSSGNRVPSPPIWERSADFACQLFIL